MTNHVATTFGGDLFHIYNSPYDFLDTFTERAVEKILSEHHARHNYCLTIREKRFNGEVLFEENLSLARYANMFEPQDFEIAYEIASKIDPAQGNKFVMDVTGDAVDIGSFNSGEPECMHNTVIDVVNNQKVINVVFKGMVSGGVGARFLKERGRAIASVVMVLMRMGYKVNFYVSAAFGARPSSRGGAILTIKILDAAEPPDFHAFSFFVSTLGFVRSLAFGYLFNCPKSFSDLAMSQGCSYVYDNLGWPKELETLETSTVELGTYCNEFNPKHLETWVLNTVRKMIQKHETRKE